MSYAMSTNSVIIGVTFGLIMPILANYLPIRAAMGKTLRSSLDMSKRTDDEIGVKVKKLEDIGIDSN